MNSYYKKARTGYTQLKVFGLTLIAMQERFTPMKGEPLYCPAINSLTCPKFPIDRSIMFQVFNDVTSIFD